MQIVIMYHSTIEHKVHVAKDYTTNYETNIWEILLIVLSEKKT